MAGVANYDANIVLGGEFQGLGNMLRRGHIDGVNNKVSQRAGLRDGAEREARAICEERRHDRGRGFQAATG